MLSEDVEDQRCPVDDLDLDDVLELAQLPGCELTVAYHGVGRGRSDDVTQLLGLAEPGRFGHRCPDTSASHSSRRTPCATSTAGPASNKRPSSHVVTDNRPPGRSTAYVAGPAESCTAATAAHAPVPQENVSPT